MIDGEMPVTPTAEVASATSSSSPSPSPLVLLESLYWTGTVGGSATVETGVRARLVVLTLRAGVGWGSSCGMLQKPQLGSVGGVLFLFLTRFNL